jgi:hypothetical protein
MKSIFRFKFSMRFILAWVALLAMVLASRNTILYHYHAWALDHAVAGESRWYVGSFEGHIRELVRLGRYEQRKFVLKNLTVDSQKARRLFIDLQSLRVSNAWLEMGPHGDDNSASAPESISVICLPEKMYLYQSLIDQADAPPASPPINRPLTIEKISTAIESSP